MVTVTREMAMDAADALIEHDAFLPLFKRVTYLASAAHEAGDASISVGSIKYMAHFICSQVRTHLPSLALTYEGNVQAEWHTTSGFLILEFLPDGVVRLGLLVPNKRYQGGVTQAAGYFAVDMVMDILRAYGAVDFFQ